MYWSILNLSPIIGTNNEHVFLKWTDSKLGQADSEEILNSYRNSKRAEWNNKGDKLTIGCLDLIKGVVIGSSLISDSK